MTVDQIKEAEDARVWEELNSDDPKRRAAVDLLYKAIEKTRELQRILSDAADKMDGTPEADRIESLGLSANIIECDIMAQTGRLLLWSFGN